MKSIIYFLTGFIVSSIIIAMFYCPIHGVPSISVGLITKCNWAFLLSIPIHELIHGVTCSYVSENNYKTISYGVKLTQFYAYCKSTIPVDPPMRKYVIIMPCVVLAVIPALIGFLFGIVALCIFAAFSFAGASKDIHSFINIINIGKKH